MVGANFPMTSQKRRQKASAICPRMIGSRGLLTRLCWAPTTQGVGSITARRAVFHAGALIDGCWVIEQLKGGHAATSVRRTFSPFRASSRAWFSSVGSSTAFGADPLPSSEKFYVSSVVPSDSFDSLDSMHSCFSKSLQHLTLFLHLVT